jgi:deazaflavin-dependent oxidoreductase (nitroreductase family)
MSDQKKPQVPPDMKTFNRALIEEFRANRGKLSGQMAASQVMVLTTMGARSGEPRSTVVGYRKHGDQLVAIASGNGSPTHPAWYRNLLVNPIATVEVGPEKFEVRTRTAAPGERDELGRVVTYLESQQKLTARQIPIVVMERTTA